MNVDQGWRSPPLPKEVIWLIVKQFVMLWVGKFFSDDGDECVVIHVTNVVVVDSWLGHPFMKWNFNIDSTLGPASTLKGLTWSSFLGTSSQLGVDGVPACSINVLWPKSRSANNLYERPKAFFRLLYSTIPVPVHKEIGQPVQVWIEKCGISTFGWVASRATIICYRRCQSQVLQHCCILWIMSWKLITIILTGKFKAISKHCEKAKSARK